MKESSFPAFLSRNRKSIIIFTVCLIAVYGIKLFNVTFAKDTEAIISIPDQLYNSWVSIDRFGLVFFKKILGIYQFNPYFAMIMMFILVILGSCIWEYLFSKMTSFSESFEKRSWIFPAVCFSAPLMASQLGFLLQAFEIAAAFIFVSLSLLLIWGFIEDKKIWKAVVSVILLSAAFSFYQGLAPLYIAGAAATFLLYAHREKKALKPIIILIVNLAVSLLIYLALNKAAHAYTGVPTDPYISNMILWKTESAAVCVNNILGHIKHALTASNSYYTLAFPFAVITAVLSLIMALRSLKKNRVIYVLAMLILLASPFIMTIINGQEAFYRTQFVMPFTAGFLIQYFIGFCAHKKIRICSAAAVCAVLMTIVCVFQQAVVTTRMYYSEYESYREDELLALKISMRIDELGLGEYPAEPLMIVGAHSSRMNPSASTEWDFEGRSFFDWYYGWEEGNTIAINYMRTLGYEYQIPTHEQAEKALAEAAKMPVWPDAGSVAVKDGVIIIHMS